MIEETQAESQEGSVGVGSGRIEIKHAYREGETPPGAVPVTERMLARYVQPGREFEPHGVPPIGVIGLPAGWVISEMYGDDGVDEVRVLPFRYPFYSRAYAMHVGEHLLAVLRNVQPNEVSAGNQVVVQFGEQRNWDAVFGRVGRVMAASMRLIQPSGEERDISHEEIKFVGKVMCWWDASAETQAAGKA